MGELHFTHNSEKKRTPVTTNCLKQIKFFKMMQFPKADMSGALRQLVLRSQTDWILVLLCIHV